MICTPCGLPVEDGYSAIVGSDAAVVLGSEQCAVKWAQAHPEYLEVLADLAAKADIG